VRVLVGRCRLGAWHWWENCRVLEHSLARLLSPGRVPLRALEVIWDVQIVMDWSTYACRGRQQALRAILQLLTQVGRSFVFWVNHDLSDCLEG
jgi:hypothetical protein